MNCSKVQKLTPLYLDSELGSETSFEIARHLEGCTLCHDRVEGEKRLEDRMGATLSRVNEDEDAAWDRAMKNSFGRRNPWRNPAIAAAAALLLSITALVLFYSGRDTLVDEMVYSHEKFLNGMLDPKVTSDDPREIAAYFGDELPFPLTLAASEDETLTGARFCSLGDARVAYVMAECKKKPVSIFLMAASELDAFPDAARMTDAGARTVGSYSLFVFRDGQRIVCAIGDVSPDELESAVCRLTCAKK